MARTIWWMGWLLVALASTGCCRWCDRWCGPGHHGYAQPVGYAAQQCVPCVPVCCPSSPAPVQQGQWQRGPYGCP